MYLLRVTTVHRAADGCLPAGCDLKRMETDGHNLQAAGDRRCRAFGAERQNWEQASLSPEVFVIGRLYHHHHHHHHISVMELGHLLTRQNKSGSLITF
jgi:hypothetical protein